MRAGLTLTDVQNFLTILRATPPYDELFAGSMCNELMSCQPIVMSTILAVPAEWQQQQKQFRRNLLRCFRGTTARSLPECA